MLDQRIMQFGFLIFLIPLQYFVIQYLSKLNYSQSIIDTDTVEAKKHRISLRDNELKEIISACSSWFSINEWHSWLLELHGKFTGSNYDSKLEIYPDELNTGSVYESRLGTSRKPQLNRPSDMSFSIGQVVYHKHWKYRGVIVGWDPVGMAPTEWFNSMYPTDKRKEWKDQPTYRILIDTRDRFAPQISYIPQDNLALEIPAKRVMHPHVDEFFEGFDGHRYLPRPWFRDIYPYG